MPAYKTENADAVIPDGGGGGWGRVGARTTQRNAHILLCFEMSKEIHKRGINLRYDVCVCVFVCLESDVSK